VTRGPISQQRSDDGRYWNPDIETASADKLRDVQEERLRHIVEHAYGNSRFYRRKFDEAGLKPEDVRTIEDLPKLPVTTKEELRDSQAREPMWGDILAVPVEQCITVHFTSATTGLPVALLDTWDVWHNGFVESYARGIYAMGVRPNDAILPAFAYGPYIGFWSAHIAMERIGCLVMPGGGASTEQRINYMRTYPITVLCCTPSYALFLAEQAQKMGIDLRKEANIRLTFHTGEPGGAIPSVKHKIEEAFGCKTYDIAGLTEIAAWGFECEPQPGGDHIHDDYVLSEVLDLDTGKPVGPGEPGELILTNLYRHAMPLLRYRTKDIVKIASTPCPCGRTFRRFEGGVIGRLDDMKKVRGVVVYPSKIEECVRSFDEVAEYQVIFHRQEGLDEITVRVEPMPQADPEFARKLQEQLRLAIGIRCGVDLLEPDSLPRWDHKARRFKDERTEVPF